MGTIKFIRLETSGWTRLESEKIFYHNFHLENKQNQEQRAKVKQKINIGKGDLNFF